jgi:hypothetical protein
MILTANNINQLISVMVTCCVLFQVRTEFLNTYNYKSFGLKGLKQGCVTRALYGARYWFSTARPDD